MGSRTSTAARDRKRAARNLRQRKRRGSRKSARPAAEDMMSIYIGPTDGSAPHLFDDCPMCRAMADMNLFPNANGVVQLERRRYPELQRRQQENIARGGLPDGAIVYSEDAFAQDYAHAERILIERGFPVDTETMTEDEVAVHLQRVVAIIEERHANEPLQPVAQA